LENRHEIAEMGLAGGGGTPVDLEVAFAEDFLDLFLSNHLLQLGGDDFVFLDGFFGWLGFLLFHYSDRIIMILPLFCYRGSDLLVVSSFNLPINRFLINL